MHKLPEFQPEEESPWLAPSTKHTFYSASWVILQGPIYLTWKAGVWLMDIEYKTKADISLHFPMSTGIYYFFLFMHDQWTSGQTQLSGILLACVFLNSLMF